MKSVVTRTARRQFLRGAGVALTGAPLIAVAQPAHQSPPSNPVVFRLQGAWSARDVYHGYALDFAKKINDMAAGRIRVEILPAGAVVKTADLLDAVHKGVLDGCHGISALWQLRDTSFALFGAAPALGLDANGFLAWMRHGGGMGLFLDILHRTHNLDAVPFFYGPLPVQPLGWFKKPVKSAADFKRLKIRASGLSAELFREMGAVIETVPEEDVTAAMKSGKLDAVELSHVSADRWPELPQAAKFCMLRSYHRPAEAFVVMFNRKKFSALPADLQAIVHHAAEAASADLSWKAPYRSWDEQDRLARQGVTFLRTPAEVLRAQLAAWGVVCARMSKLNPVFERVWLSQREWSRHAVAWSRDTAVDAGLAHDFWAAKRRGA